MSMYPADTHSFNIHIAKELGIEEAVVISNFQWWLNKNAANGINQHDGRTWTYNTQEALVKLFPYMNRNKIRYVIDGLVKSGILVKGNYNKSTYDRTVWYAFNDEKKWLYASGNNPLETPESIENTEMIKSGLSIGEFSPMEAGKFTSPTGEIYQTIPDINTNITTDINNNSLSHEREESTIFTQELPPPSANRPTVDKEVETLTAEDVVKYLAAMAMTLPEKEARTFINHYEGQSWHTNKGAPISNWRAYARKWYDDYKQYIENKPNEAARKPAKSNEKSVDKHNRFTQPDYYAGMNDDGSF